MISFFPGKGCLFIFQVSHNHLYIRWFKDQIVRLITKNTSYLKSKGKRRDIATRELARSPRPWSHSESSGISTDLFLCLAGQLPRVKKLGKSWLGEVHVVEPMHRLLPCHHGHFMPELNEQALGCLDKELPDIHAVGHLLCLMIESSLSRACVEVSICKGRKSSYGMCPGQRPVYSSNSTFELLLVSLPVLLYPVFWPCDYTVNRFPWMSEDSDSGYLYEK